MYLRMALMEKTPGAQKMTNELLDITRAWIQVLADRKLLRKGTDVEYAALFMMFQLIGPLILEPFSKHLTGGSMYAPKAISKRSELLMRALSQGLIKDSA